MNKKTIHLLALLMLLFQSVNASPSALGITFHIFGSGPTDQQLADAVCIINGNFQNTDVRFYLNSIKRKKSSPTNENHAMQLSPKEGQINIYEFGSNYFHSNNFGDAIYGPSLVATSQLTHEIGHLLNLLHTDGTGDGATACSPCINDDCCADTWPGMPNNWMNQGATSGTFTGDQNMRMLSCINARGWNGGPGGLVSNINRIVPYDYFSVGTHNGTFTWMFPTMCSPDMPTHTNIIVTTKCAEGADEHQVLYTCYDLTTPFNVSLAWGITRIRLEYWYGSTVTVIERNYTAEATNTSPCTYDEGGGNGKPSGIKTMSMPGEYYLVLQNNASVSGLNIRNTGYDAVNVYDLSGRKLQTIKIVDGDNNIDISWLATGTYILKATNGAHEAHYKFQKL